MEAVFFENAGWERPQWYDANEGLLDSLTVTGESRSGWEAREWSPTAAAEHVATRQRVAMFDLTPFAKFEVTGSGALDALQRLASNQMNTPVGTITYTSMLTPAGGIKCDLTVTRLGEDRFMIVTGGAMGLHDLDWIETHVPDHLPVNVNDVSSGLCCMTLNDPAVVVMGKEPIVDGDDVLGYVTSANYGHSIGRGIVYGYLHTSHTEAGTSVDVLYFGERLQATVAKEPLYDPVGRKMRA